MPQSLTQQSLYPLPQPFAADWFDTGDGHQIYYEQSGNPQGKPVVALHGGPGGGGDTALRRFFDPALYRIIIFDQRGAGRSKPYASLDSNTTQHLIADIEQLREILAIERWQVFGGSWGSTLALAYAEAHPDRVTELVLRGIFLLRQAELDWFYRPGGASRIFPDAWVSYETHIPVAERGDLPAAYYKRLTSTDNKVRIDAARAWSVWEAATSHLEPSPSTIDKFKGQAIAEAFARIECHYFQNAGFMAEGQLLENVDRIRGIPGVIVQGRYDVVCPAVSAWDLHQCWPEAELKIIPDAGHSAFEPGIAAALVAATDQFARN